MIRIAGIRFKTAGRIYNFDSGDFVLKMNDKVIVDTDQGPGLGYVATLPNEIEALLPGFPPLKPILRIAEEEDLEQLVKNSEVEKQAYTFCKEKGMELGLEMNLFHVESSFDGTKLVFFFTADGRVDFRQLVKELVKEFRARIEMRQVGIRNRSKILGGIGRCGRELCCCSYLEEFEPVSIRMAKEQGLSLNPTKISGVCGRLMCCLTYENEAYIHLKSNFPKIGKSVMTPQGRGKVTRHNAIGGRIAVKLDDDGMEIEIKLDEISNRQENQNE